MRILTAAVRRALAEQPVPGPGPRPRDAGDERTPDEPQPQPPPPLPFPREGLIPCAAASPKPKKRAREGEGEGDASASPRGGKRKAREGAPAASASTSTAASASASPPASPPAPTEESPIVKWTAATIPEDLKKYWYQRQRLFHLFDSGVLLDRESWYSVTPQSIAQQIAERCSCDVVVDAFCGAGGNAIQFAMTCGKVIAIDVDPVKIRTARHNAKIYEVDDTIEFVCADFVEWAKKQKRGSADVVFLSPPWGGMDYLAAKMDDETDLTRGTYPLSATSPLPADQLFALARRITPDVAMYLPRNTDMLALGALAAPEEQVEVEEVGMSGKCKALTAYFGGLVASEEDRDSA